MEATVLDRKILRRLEVQKMTGLPTSTLYALMSRGEFPRPVQLSKKAVGWAIGDVAAWVDSRPRQESVASDGSVGAAAAAHVLHEIKSERTTVNTAWLRYVELAVRHGWQSATCREFLTVIVAQALT